MFHPAASAPAPDWARLRARFPILEHKTYLNNCAYGALSTDVAAAVNRYLDERTSRGVDWDDWVGHNEGLRRSLAALLGADADEIALTTSASAGLNALASALSFEAPRNRIVTTDLEFATHGQIWHAQTLRGAQVEQLRARDGIVELEQFERAIDDRTLLVSTSHVAYRNGVRQDVAALAELAHRRGATLLIDDFQSAGTSVRLPNALGADFVIGGTFKYLLGTAGIAYLYVRRALIEQLLPSATGWFAQADVFAMDPTAYRPSPTARRFEAGTPPVVNTYAAGAGIAILQEVGLAAIERRIGELTAAIKTEAQAAGYPIATPTDASRHGALIALRTHDERRLVAELLAHDIVTSSREGNLRISPHFYNDAGDIERLFRALHEQRALLVS